MMIFLSMLAVGVLLGFAGTGESGLILGLLVALFGVPIHMALGTSITAMVFTTLSGALSHFREGNTLLRTGVIIGLFGAIGSYFGTYISRDIDPSLLVWLTAIMLLLSAFFIWLRTRLTFQNDSNQIEPKWNSISFWMLALSSGLLTGGLSGMFGIGSTPFIQLALLVFFKLPLRLAVGTTMVVILPIALAASIGFTQAGFLNWLILVQVTLGTMIGAFIMLL
jgi:uncharacterized membrane protein YfcA